MKSRVLSLPLVLKLKEATLTEFLNGAEEKWGKGFAVENFEGFELHD